MSKKTAAKKSRNDILLALVGGLVGRLGDLTEEEADLGLQIIELEFNCDFGAAAAHVQAVCEAHVSADIIADFVAATAA